VDIDIPNVQKKSTCTGRSLQTNPIIGRFATLGEWVKKKGIRKGGPALTERRGNAYRCLAKGGASRLGRGPPFWLFKGEPLSFHLSGSTGGGKGQICRGDSPRSSDAGRSFSINELVSLESLFYFARGRCKPTKGRFRGPRTRAYSEGHFFQVPLKHYICHSKGDLKRGACRDEGDAHTGIKEVSAQ